MIITIIIIVIIIRGGVAEKESIKSAFFIGYVIMQVTNDHDNANHDDAIMQVLMMMLVPMSMSSCRCPMTMMMLIMGMSSYQFFWRCHHAVGHDDADYENVIMQVLIILFMYQTNCMQC